MQDLELDDAQHITLCEALDRVLNKGAVIVGEVMISVANVDLIYLGLQIVLTSVESAASTKELSDGRSGFGLAVAGGTSYDVRTNSPGAL